MIALQSFSFTAMGTDCALLLYAESEEAASPVAAAAIAEVRRIERTYSRYRSDSVVHAINRVAQMGGSIDVDGETAELIEIAFDAFRRSGGLFDITSGVLREVWNARTKALPSDAAIGHVLARIGLQKVEWNRPALRFRQAGMEIDLGGIGKEYAADKAAAICREARIAHGLVDLGGDIAIIGPNPDGSPWRVGVCDPQTPANALATLFVPSGGVATSGDYQRYWEIEGRRFGHILNPLTGWPVSGPRSITVAAGTCLEAGLCSTIAMLKGAGGPRWLRENGLAHVFVDAAGAVDLSGIVSAGNGAGTAAGGLAVELRHELGHALDEILP
jgi:FAD:protein FMN transferase